MPGAYAHLTLIRKMVQGLDRLPDPIPAAYRNNTEFAALGAVSPDLAYLAPGAEDAGSWADHMHYDNTLDLIRAGLRRLRGMEEGAAREKCLAWLLGYSSHVVMDCTIHPVIEAKVGIYQKNQTAHRVCELHQDAYIFQDLNLGEVGAARLLDASVGACGDAQDPDALDRDISRFWLGMLKDVYPGYYAANPPDLSAFWKEFKWALGKIASQGYMLVPRARRLGVDLGLTYPKHDEVDEQYIKYLPSPRSAADTVHYREVFNQARRNVGAVWKAVAEGASAAPGAPLAGLGNWDLDTGLNKQTGQSVYWSLS